MFYCELCRETNGWPEAMFKSYGPCEECGHTARCHEVASPKLTTWDSARDAMSKPLMTTWRHKS